MAQIPSSLQPVLWSVNVNHLDLNRDKGYIIHQVLNYGDFTDLRWLLQTYSKSDIVDVFVNRPSKTYPKPVYQFVKNYILGLKNRELDENAYITSIHGPVRPRTAESL